MKYQHEDLEMQGTMHMITVHLPSCHSCYRNRNTSMTHLVWVVGFFFDAELPEMSDSESKLHIMRGFDVCCVVGGGCFTML